MVIYLSKFLYLALLREYLGYSWPTALLINFGIIFSSYTHREAIFSRFVWNHTQSVNQYGENNHLVIFNYP